ncbi:MAG TPA: 16S rRNA (guanine(966)-N(2))-methyltransferase RsmD [Trebonia sp.]|jgi:16S rRNA (guanine966-N2)-methyltransferase|nr:16S rRNA (guanine(966)-N(2))-methyltransferase RsmD [Trebonia sp.]
MTRVIAGQAGGRRLAVPPGTTTRPTSDRAREGLFASLLSELGSFDGARVLDLYAGSGAIGLEALSRGAERVLLIESDPRAAAVIKANIAAVALPGATVATGKVERLLAHPPDKNGNDNNNNKDNKRNTNSYDLVIADPPYALTEAAVTTVLTLLQAGWLNDGALVVVERATRSGPLDWPPGFLPAKSRRYGEATFWYGWYGGEAEAGQTGTASRSEA